MNSEAPVIIEPAAEHRASIIWLHGLGADGHDFEPIVPELHLPAELGVRFIFPHAPQQPVTINGGMVMRAWYDVRDPDLTRQEDAESIVASARLLHDWIAQEIAAGIPGHRIVAAGFSQGGAIALHGGLRYPERLAGILGLSCYLPLPGRLADEVAAANRETPVLMLHGSHDPLIPVEQGRAACEQLRQAGYPVDWQEYPMQHSVCLEEISDISRWLQQVLRN